MDLVKLKAPSSEEEITKYWKYNDKVYVSVICATYNQTSYIRDAIESFLAQKTEYRFEIIIHDDASTDGTAEIVREYQKKFPNIINVILQKENQHSQGKRITMLAAEKGMGEYVAICEGDDYWCDDKKLNYQYKRMQANPKCDLSFHSCHYLYRNGKTSLMHKYNDTETIIDLDEVISRGGAYMATASLMLKKQVIVNMPAWFMNAPSGSDYFYQIFGSMNGGALYLSEPMAVYRRFSDNSWSSKFEGESIYKKLALMERIHTYLDKINKLLTVDHTKSINQYKSGNYFYIAVSALENKNYDFFKANIIKSWDFRKRSNMTQSLLFLIKSHPKLAYLLIIFKSYIRRKFNRQQK